MAVSWVVFGTGIVMSPGAAGASTLPVLYNGAVGYSHASSTASPPGANNWACRPSVAHPRPVVLVHGTFGDMSDSWQALSPLLANNGYCVFALNYGSADGSGALGVYGVGDIPQSAQQLATFVDQILTATKARQVDIVGHSQGGMMPRYYMKFLGGAAKVHTLVGLAPSNHGTTIDGLSTVSAYLPDADQFTGAVCAACAATGGRFILHDCSQRRRRYAQGCALHGYRERVRRSCHPIHVGVSVRTQRDEHYAAKSVSPRFRRTPLDAL